MIVTAIILLLFTSPKQRRASDIRGLTNQTWISLDPSLITNDIRAENSYPAYYSHSVCMGGAGLSVLANDSIVTVGDVDAP